MTIRDLGYRPYEGERLPPTNNVRVLLRHGLVRAWGSLLVKLAVFLGILPAAGFVLIAVITTLTARAQGAPVETLLDAPKLLKSLLMIQVWVFVFPATIGAGASSIAEDLAQRAFQFYFAKPVTPAQYLAGRMGAVGLVSLALVLVPALLLAAALVALGGKELLVERLGLVIPALIQCVLVALVMGTASVGVSSVGKSRALTASAWILLFLVPYVVSVLVFQIGHVAWLQLASIPALLEVVNDALFKQPEPGDLSWAHALPMLGIFTVLSTTLAYHRLTRAEVIA